MKNTDRIDTEDLQGLIANRVWPRVSLYVPTERSGQNAKKAPIILKKFLAQATEELKPDRRWNEISRVLDPARNLLDDPEFWMHQAEGLALFLGDGFFRCYRLPHSFEGSCHVGDTFYVKPLLPLFANNGPFVLMALSENQVRVFEGDRDALRALNVPGLPASMADALAADDPESQLQWHSGAGPSTSGGGRKAMFFGTGDGPGMEQHKANLKRYFDLVDKPLRDRLARLGTPLMLAGVDYLLPIYREANSYPLLVEEALTGNFDRATPEELHKRAWALLEPRFRAGEQDAIERFRLGAAQGLASAEVPEVVAAAFDGRVDTLIIALGEGLPGTYDRERREIAPAKGSDLVNEVAIETMAKGGRVFALAKERVPAETPMAAILRY